MAAQEKAPIHIGKADVEKIPLGQGKFLYHISDRFFINTHNQAGERVWEEIPQGEKVHFGNETISIPHNLFFGEERIVLTAHDVVSSKKFWERGLRRVERVFCNHLFFRAEPKTITGIMGPSGAGKTVLLNLLSGYISSPQNRGRIFINHKFDVHKDRRFLGRAIGYVPQDDTLIPQLTVEQSLDYCFRLRYAGVESLLKKSIIRTTCHHSGFGEGRLLEVLLNNQIGSPDAKILSGGQRKRVNIAHELIRNPLLLFLDEPTSGLSSVDSDKVLESLRALCDDTRITIVLTIHQPSIPAFEQLNRLLVLNKGGEIVYFGERDDAVAYFERNTGISCQAGQNPAEYILKALEKWEEKLKAGLPPDMSEDRRDAEVVQQIASVYRSRPYYFPFFSPQGCPEQADLPSEAFSLEIDEAFLQQLRQHDTPEYVIAALAQLQYQEFFWRRDFLNTLQKQLGPDNYTEELGEQLLEQVFATQALQKTEAIAREKPEQFPRLSTSFLHQFWVLLQRNLTVARADKNNKRFQLLQPVVIACLMLLAFAWYTQDYYSENILSRIGYEFSQKWGRETIIPSRDIQDFKKQAYKERQLLSEGAGNRRAAIFFLLIASCIWLGIINACREIVDERTILRREAKSTLRISSYLMAKVVFLAWTCGKQVGLLLAIIYLPNLALKSNLLPQHFRSALASTSLLNDIYPLAVFIMLWSTAVFASWLGLFISALAPTQRFALTAVPILIIPQLLLGGLIRPIKDIDTSSSFMITPEVMTQLKEEDIADDVFAALGADRLQYQRFTKENDFLYAVEMELGGKPDRPTRDLLLEHARVSGMWTWLQSAIHVHDFMLQKWAFLAMLLYDSSGDIKILQRKADISQYDRYKYRYLEFETVKLVDLFFDLQSDELRLSALQSQELFTLFPHIRKTLSRYMKSEDEMVLLALNLMPEHQRRRLPQAALDKLNYYKNLIDRERRNNQLYGMTGWLLLVHAVVLLLPTYLWLKKKFQV